MWDTAAIKAQTLLGTDVGETLTGFIGSDVIEGRGGNDNLTGGDGNDTIRGGDGVDTLNGNNGNDILDGGTGNDSMFGGASDDVYVFGRGYGQDLLLDNEVTAGGTNIIRFTADVNPADVRATQVGANLVLTITGTPDTLTIYNYFYGNRDVNSYQTEQVQFADGTVWDTAAIKAQTLLGTDVGETLTGFIGSDVIEGRGGNDNLTGGDGNDTIRGGDGVDTLNGNNGNDILDGGTGNDSMFGGASDDTLDGGGGNDWLDGSTGNDTYVFGRGYGQDTLSDLDGTVGNIDAIRFAADVVPADVRGARNGNNLILSIVGTTDTLTVTNYFNGTGINTSYVIEQVQFADGTTWDSVTVMALVSNLAPTLSATIIAQTANEDAAFAFQVPAGAFTDPNAGDTLIYKVTLANGSPLPSWLTFDSSTQTLSGTPTNGDVGALTFTVVATDRFGLTASQNFGVTVNNVNDAPVVSAVLADQTVAEDAAFSFTVPSNTFADIDVGDTLSLSATLADGTPLPAWLTFNAATQTFSGTPGNSNVGGIQVTVIATDGSGASISDTFALVVTNTNDAPTVVTPIADQRGREGAPFSYQVPTSSFADMDVGDSLTYTVTLANGDPLPTWLSYDAVTKTLSGLPGSSNVGQLDIKVTATDLGGLTTSDIFALIVDSKTTTGTTGNDTLVGTAYEDILLGLGGNDILTGNAGNDTLDGGVGKDTMTGGAGNDFYVVDSTTDVVTENAAEGTDQVQSSITYTLGNNVENLTLTGTTAINGTGNTLDNVLIGNSANNTLTGNAGNDTLDGGLGTDTMVGGAGNDTYVVNVSTDVVTEGTNAGTDTVLSSITYTAAANVENVTLTGTAAINATGNTLNNVLTGNSANNTLSGGTGTDTMLGGAGNDTYVVDNVGDIVTESANDGMDLVQTSVTYTLSNNVENLTLTGTTAINGTGNLLNNILTGNSANNTLTAGAGDDVLDGGTGKDTMLGGTGNDTYVVNVATDVVTENANEGTDTVQSIVTLTLGNNVENLTLTGTTAINGTGNTLDNVLTGNSANNTLTGNAGNDYLDGGAGTDTMRGGVGNDTYVVNVSTDVVTENVNEGTDTVLSGITYTAAANIENVTLTGTTAINATGNTLSNTLAGNSANNVLTGGTGNDSYLIGRGSAQDSISENDATAGNTDVVQFGAGVNNDQLWFAHTGNNLEISIIGSTDKVTIQNWYTSGAYHTEQIRTSNGQLLLDTQVENLVNAMAAFVPPAAGQTTLPPAYQDTLAPVIAANWQAA